MQGAEQLSPEALAGGTVNVLLREGPGRNCFKVGMPQKLPDPRRCSKNRPGPTEWGDSSGQGLQSTEERQKEVLLESWALRGPRGESIRKRGLRCPFQGNTY